MVRSENKKIDALPLKPRPRHGMTPCPGKTSRYRSVFTDFSILIEFEATEYSYSIRFFFEISRIFDSNEIPDSSVPHFILNFAKLAIMCIFRFANMYNNLCMAKA